MDGKITTTNTVEGFFGIFSGMTVFTSTARTSLAGVFEEFDFRYSNRIKLGVDDTERTVRAVKGAGKRRPISNLVQSQAS